MCCDRRMIRVSMKKKIEANKIKIRLLQESEADEEFREAFKVFDKDQDGYISPTEVRALTINTPLQFFFWLSI